MDGWLLQDWVTIRAKNSGGTSITSITQGADSWLDIGDAEDFSFFLDVREITSGTSATTIYYETSPTCQETSFAAMASFAPITGQRVDRVVSSIAGIPPARFIRWRLATANAGGGDWDITFRIWLAAYAWVKP
jgi:hypothetical protein